MAATIGASGGPYFSPSVIDPKTYDVQNPSLSDSVTLIAHQNCQISLHMRIARFRFLQASRVPVGLPAHRITARDMETCLFALRFGRRVGDIVLAATKSPDIYGRSTYWTYVLFLSPRHIFICTGSKTRGCFDSL